MTPPAHTERTDTIIMHHRCDTAQRTQRVPLGRLSTDRELLPLGADRRWSAWCQCSSLKRHSAGEFRWAVSGRAGPALEGPSEGLGLLGMLVGGDGVDRESGADEDRRDVSGEVATSEEGLVDRLDAALSAGHLLIG